MSLGHERACINQDMINGWFDGLYAHLEKEVPDYKSLIKNPRRIFNADESGFPLHVKTGKVLAPTGSKNVYHVVNNTKIQISVMAGFNAFGEYVPPMILYPGERFRDVGLEGFPEATFAHSTNGWMDSVAFVEYLKTLYKFAKDKEIQFPILLIVDGSSTHISLEASEYCSENSIILYCLLANATHILQACDIGFFSPMKTVWKAMVKEWQMSHVGEVLTKKQFPEVFRKTWYRVATLENSAHGFRRSGLYPLSPDGIDKSKLGPSQMTVREVLPSTPVTIPQPSVSYSDVLAVNPEIIEAPEVVVAQSVEVVVSPEIVVPENVDNSLISNNSSTSESTVQQVQFAVSPDNSFSETQSSSQPMPLRSIDTNVKMQEAGANTQSYSVFRSDHSYVSPAFSNLCVPQPKIRKQRDTLRSKLPKALSGTEAIKLLREKKQQKEEEEIAKQNRKEERELKKRLKQNEMERKKQEREMKKKEKEALKKQKEAEKQKKKSKAKRKRVPESDSSDENNENIHYAETDSDAEFEEVCPGCYTSVGGRFSWVGCEACPSWWHINCINGGAMRDLSPAERKTHIFICPHCQ